MTYAGILRELLRNSFGFYEEMDAKKRRDYVLELVRQLIALEKQEPYFAMAVSLIAANVMWGVYLDSGGLRLREGHLRAHRQTGVRVTWRSWRYCSSSSGNSTRTTT